MPGTVIEFLAEFNKKGVAKSSHFDVLFPPLPFLLNRPSIPQSYLTFRCEAGELPGRQLATSDIKIYGPVYRIPYQSVYAEIVLTFIETGEMDLKFFFEEWMNAIWHQPTNRLAYPDTYLIDFDIRQYDMISSQPDQQGHGGIAGGPEIVVEEDGSRSRVFHELHLRKTLTAHLYRAFPTNVNQMTTAWVDDSLHRLQVTFFYQSYSLTHHTTNKERENRSPVPSISAGEVEIDGQTFRRDLKE